MFLPKKSNVMQNILLQADVVKEACEMFKNICSDKTLWKTGHLKMEELERKSDGFVHMITNEIEKTFLLPFDKEDIEDLTEHLDDILDFLEQTSNRISIYKIERCNSDIKRFAILIAESVEQICLALVKLNEGKFPLIMDFCKKLHELENTGDLLHREILEKIMNGRYAKNILLILKWKEIFQNLEDTLDKCEDFAVSFERLRIKYG